MRNSPEERETLARLVGWGEAQESARAMILISTRAVPESVPGASLDILSDYDVILILTDIHPFAESRDWLAAFGRVLTLYRDPILREDGFEKSGNVVQFEGGLKIDFTLMPVEMLRWIAALPHLPDEFDAGYRVLLDKDHLTGDLKPPTYRAYIPKPPTEAEYRENVEDFFLIAIYVGKLLWRDDLIAAKYLLDGMMKQERLIPMLVWQMEIEHGWAVKAGPYGRGLKRWLRPDRWAELETTYAGAGTAANWEALYASMALFRRAARAVGVALGYAYLDGVDERAAAHAQKLQQLPPDAESFG